MEGKGHHDVGGWTHVPGRHANRLLQPYSTPVTICGNLLDIEVHANLAAFTLHEETLVNSTRANFSSNHLDRGVADTGLLEMEGGLVEVKFTLRDVRAVIKIGRTNWMVITQAALPLENTFDDTLAILQVLHRTPQIRVVAVRVILTRNNVDVTTRSQRPEFLACSSFNSWNSLSRNVHHGIDVTGKERVQASRAVSNTEVFDLIKVGAFFPVIVVVNTDRTDTRFEFLQLERTGTHGGGEISLAILDDLEVEGTKSDRKVSVWRCQNSANLIIVYLLPGVDHADQRGCLGNRIRAEVTVHRIDHVISGEGLAIMEGNALADLKGPHGGV